MPKTKLSIKRLSVGVVVALYCLVWPLASWGTTISDPSGLNPAATIINFDSYATGTPGPIVQDIATISASPAYAVITEFNATLPPSQFASGKYFGFFYVDYTITLSTPVAQFGLAVVGPSFEGNTLTAYGTTGQVLESIPVPYDPPDVESFFVGFVDSSNDIAKVVLSHVGYDYIGIDNVSYYAQPVPAPPTLLLLGSGLLGLIGLGRRKFFPKT